MPKVNTRFFACPSCKQCVRFEEKIVVVFVLNDDGSRGVTYEKKHEYHCTACGHVIKE